MLDSRQDSDTRTRKTEWVGPRLTLSTSFSLIGPAAIVLDRCGRRTGSSGSHPVSPQRGRHGREAARQSAGPCQRDPRSTHGRQRTVKNPIPAGPAPVETAARCTRVSIHVRASDGLVHCCRGGRQCSLTKPKRMLGLRDAPPRGRQACRAFVAGGHLV